MDGVRVPQSSPVGVCLFGPGTEGFLSDALCSNPVGLRCSAPAMQNAIRGILLGCVATSQSAITLPVCCSLLLLLQRCRISARRPECPSTHLCWEHDLLSLPLPFPCPLAYLVCLLANTSANTPIIMTILLRRHCPRLARPRLARPRLTRRRRPLPWLLLLLLPLLLLLLLLLLPRQVWVPHMRLSILGLVVVARRVSNSRRWMHN
jgi:hypothetical protein